MKKIALMFLAVLLLTACSTPKEKTYEFTAADFSKIDGSTVCIPLAESWAENLLDIKDGAEVIKFNTTPEAIKNLISGEKEIIFTTYPSEEEVANAAANGVEFEIVPIVNDAFVFLVNEDNAVENLSQEQIKKIYTGEITNWSELGGEDLSIMAFQREANSGSQSGMLRFMGNLPLANAPTETRIAGMDGLVDKIISPDNGKASIGYSYYYYVNAMYIKEGIKLLSVDGVKPNNETIKSKKYPIVTPYYAIIRKDAAADSFARKFLSYALSKQGQELAETSGYVGI